MKTIFTFGSDHINHKKINPLDTMMIVEAKNDSEAREIVMKSKIGRNFCTTYPYSKANLFKERYNMKEYTMKELIKMISSKAN